MIGYFLETRFELLGEAMHVEKESGAIRREFQKTVKIEPRSFSINLSLSAFYAH